MNAPIDISGVTLCTPRLLLRPWQESDLDDFYEYASVDGVGQMAAVRKHPEIFVVRIHESLSALAADKNCGVFLVSLAVAFSAGDEIDISVAVLLSDSDVLGRFSLDVRVYHSLLLIW